MSNNREQHPYGNSTVMEVEAEDAEEFHTLKNGKRAQIVSGLDRPYKPKPIGEQSRAVRRQALMVILGNVGVLSTGICLGMPTVTLGQLRDETEPVHLTITQGSWFASINTLTCPLGGLLSALILDRFGRKNTLYVVNIIALIAWTLLATASQTNSDAFYMQLLVSRFISGFAMGASSAPSGVYSAEISMPKIRGCLILGTSISVAAGITFIYLIGLFIRNDYRLMALILIGYQIIALMCVIPLPETPSWLLSKRRIEAARASLNYFRGLEKSDVITHPEVLEEFNMLQKSMQLRDGESKPSFLQCLRLPEVYKPLLILMGLFAMQQFTGIFVIIVYAAQIAEKAGVTIDYFLCAVLIGIARVVTTGLMGIILERWGRRRAGMISALGMAICMFLLAGSSWFTFIHNIPYLALVAIVAFIVFSTLGLYTLPFFMISELFPQKVRGPASGLTVAVGMFFAFVCIKTYPDMEASIGYANCFLFFGIMSLVGIVFIYMVLPETRGRTLLEIEEQFRNKNSGMRKTPTAVEMQNVYVR